MWSIHENVLHNAGQSGNSMFPSCRDGVIVRGSKHVTKADLSVDYHSPSNEVKPVYTKLSKRCLIVRRKLTRRKIGQYLFFSIILHQCHALVKRPSMHDPASTKLSAPDPSKLKKAEFNKFNESYHLTYPCLKKSPRISRYTLSMLPNSISIYFARAGCFIRFGIWERVLQMGNRMRYIWVYLSGEGD